VQAVKDGPIFFFLTSAFGVAPNASEHRFAFFYYCQVL
jgi:hypothetical protein